jgi:hypothetical protein
MSVNAGGTGEIGRRLLGLSLASSQIIAQILTVLLVLVSSRIAAHCIGPRSIRGDTLWLPGHELQATPSDLKRQLGHAVNLAAG